MALGFLKKVFSFGKKETAVEQPVADEALPPLNLDALEAFKRDEVPEAVAPEPGPAALPAVPEEVPAPTPEPVIAPEDPAPVVEPVPVEIPRQPEPAPAPSPEIPQPALLEIEPEPVPAALPPVPEEVPLPTPEPVIAPEEPAPVFEPVPVEIPQQPEPAPAPLPEIPQPALPEIEPEPVPAAPPPVPEEVPLPTPEPVIAPEEPAPVFEPAPVEIPRQPEPAPVPPPVEIPPAAPVEMPPAPTDTPLPAPTADAQRAEAVPPAGKVTVAKTVAQKSEPVPVAAEPAARQSWFQRLREGLSRSSRELTGNVAGLFTKRRLDEDTLQDLEDVLIRADLGVETALRITDSLASGRYGKNVSDEEVRAVMAEEIGKVLTPVAQPLELDLSHKPHVILVVGVNGTGKTTTIGKLAAKLTDGGLSVMLAAGDTFRAAAIEQLKIWGERTKSPVVSSKLGADAAGLAYDAFEKAKESGSDVLIIDTAGRLQNKTELMAELEKIVRVLGKLDPEAPHTVLQTVDATTGQNALNQVEIFRNIAGVNGLVMTKLDGTARGGILVGIAAKHKIPVYFIGVGEQVEDLEPFSASDFAKAIAGVG